MVLALQGTGVSTGIAIGKANILQRDAPEIPQYVLTREMIPQEIARYRFALNTAREHLDEIRQRIPHNAPPEIAAFIDTHLLMLEDAALARVPVELIRSHQCNAEWALKLQRDTLVNVFEEMDDAYLRTRRDDVDHVVSYIQNVLLNSPVPHEGSHDARFQGRIVVAEDLSPADTVLMQQQGIAAFVTESGGPTSHTAILSRSLGIPAVVGMRHAQRYLHEGETLIVDGRSGTLLASADEPLLAFYRERQTQEQAHRRGLNRLRDLPATTRDGKTISLQANIELREDVAAVAKVGANGVGLYRTEFLFMNRSEPPGEAEQFETYRQVVRELDGAPITIRTLDLGADKQVDGGDGAANPALGLRAIRLCLREPALFIPQLRAILRASAEGPVRMMLPMLTSVQELKQVLAMVQRTREDLRREGIRFDPALPVGGMIEVPAAALGADTFARQLDFLSIGTNDLIQYTLAIDRVDDEVNYLYDPLHPAVLKLIQLTLRGARKAGKPVAMCGEMAGDTRYTRLLVGMGLSEFSMHPSFLPEVKDVIKHTDTRSIEADVRRLLRASEHGRILELLEAINRHP